MKQANAISPERMNASGREKSPSSSRPPPNSSSTPASPISENSCTLAWPPAPGKPNSFCAPCCMNTNAATMRSTLKRNGDHFVQNAPALAMIVSPVSVAVAVESSRSRAVGDGPEEHLQLSSPPTAIRRSRPLVRVRPELAAALRADHAEALAGRRFHHHPGLDRFDLFGAQRFQPPHLGFDVVALDVQVHAALVFHALHHHDRFVLVCLDIHVLAVVVRLVRTAERPRPEFRRGFQVVGPAIDHDAAQPAVVHDFLLACAMRTTLPAPSPPSALARSTPRARAQRRPRRPLSARRCRASAPARMCRPARCRDPAPR